MHASRIVGSRSTLADPHAKWQSYTQQGTPQRRAEKWIPKAASPVRTQGQIHGLWFKQMISKIRVKSTWAKSSIKANRISESILSCLLGCQPDSAFFFQLTNTCHRHKSPSLSKCHGVQSTLPSNIAWEPGLVHVMCRQHLSEVSFSEPLAVANHALGVPTVTRPCFIDRRSSHTARREKGSRPLVGSSKTTSRDPPRKAMPFGPVGALQKFQEVNPYRLPTKLYSSF